MTEYVWADLRNNATTSYGEPPGAALEQKLIDIFQTHPAAIAGLIDTIAAKVKNGQVRSGWAILAAEAERLTTLTETKATDTNQRQKAIARAEQRTRVELIHYDRWPEVEDELFGDRGPLRTWPELKPRFEKLWEAERPRGEAVDQAELERAERWKNTHPHGSAHHPDEATLATPQTETEPPHTADIRDQIETYATPTEADW